MAKPIAGRPSRLSVTEYATSPARARTVKPAARPAASAVSLRPSSGAYTVQTGAAGAGAPAMRRPPTS